MAAQETLIAARDIAIEIQDVYHRDQHLQVIAYAQLRAGLYDEAKATATEIQDAYVQGKVMKEIAVAQARAGLFREAKDTVQITSFAARWVLEEIMVLQAQAGLFREANGTLKKVSIPEGVDRNKILGELAIDQARAGFLSKAICTLNSMRDQPFMITTHALTSIASMETIIHRDSPLGRDSSAAWEGRVMPVSAQTFSFLPIPKRRVSSRSRRFAKRD